MRLRLSLNIVVLMGLNISGLIETEKWVNGCGGGGFALLWCG
jgi:hypothetical protein